ncbi:MAG: 3'-5' exonuclease domain-containing protein 2 [Muribaculaceae bacterium]|nr:3'-5' exonuclease domain-containing protein 2 [Muribaculaceae bacterium]
MTHQIPTISISKEALTTLPVTAYAGGITVVDTMDKARAAVRYLRKARLIGFDTETRPSFRKGLTYKVALMQLYTDNHCFLFRLNKIGFPDGLREILENPDIVKIGLSVHDDFTVLRRICPDFKPQSFIELQTYVKQFGISDISLQKIYAIVFGQYMSKNQRLTNWEAAELNPAQQAYAALDAKACLDLYVHMRQGSFDPWKSEFITDSTPHTVN